MSKKKRASLQDIIRKRQQEEFVGRSEQLDLFRTNLARSWDDEQRLFLFNVFGQGGVGKSTLLKRFREIASEMGAVSALVDEQEIDVPSVLAQFAAQLKKQGYELKQFEARYKTYRQKREELEADPEAPQDFVSFAAQSLTKATTHIVRHTVPGSGMVLDLVDEDAIATQAGEWADYVRRRLTNKDEVRLLLRPDEILTPIFLNDLSEIEQTKAIVLLFDTYERTGSYLDEWLRNLLSGRHGDVPVDIVLVIAGRDALDRNLWLSFTGVMASFSLEPFTESEARNYLASKNISNEQVVDVILKLSGRLPLLVATLATESPNDPSSVGEPSGTAIARFLKWVDDPRLQQVALHAALPRYLNYDVFAVLFPENTEAHFNWLKKMPFVKEQAKGLVYHDLVRDQMLRYLRRESSQLWSSLHGDLATFYESLRDDMGMNMVDGVSDDFWQSYALGACYHCLCQSPRQFLGTAINQWLDALKARRTFAQRWAGIINQVSLDSENRELNIWSKQLVECLQAFEDENYPQVIEIFDALLHRDDIEPTQRAIAHAWRAEASRLMGRFEDAIANFSEAIELDPDYKWAIAQRGTTYRLMEQYEEALSDLDRTIQLDPEYTWAHNEKGRIYTSMKDYTKAIAQYSLCLKVDPKYKWALGNRGLIYRLMENYEEALQNLTQAIELDPEYKWAILQRGRTYRSMKMYEEALGEFDRVIELDPEYKWAFSNRGSLYHLLQKYEEAVRDFDRAIELDSEYAWAVAQRGLMYRLMEKYQEALADFDRAIELDSEYIWPIAQRGYTYRLLGKHEEAIQSFDRAIELDGEFAWAISSRGGCLLQTRRYKEALENLDMAVQLDSSKSWTLYQRAVAHLLLGDDENSTRDLSTAVQIAEEQYEKDPEDWGNTFDLGFYKLVMGEEKAANAIFREALEKGFPRDLLLWGITALNERHRLLPEQPDVTAMRNKLRHHLETRRNE